MTSFAYDKKNKKISLKTCPQVEYQVLSLTNNVVFQELLMMITRRFGLIQVS